MSHEGIRKKYLVLVEGDVDTLGSRFELFFAGRYRGSSKVSVSSRISPRARPGSCTWSTIHQTVLETGGGQTVPVSALEVRPRIPFAPPAAAPGNPDALAMKPALHAPLHAPEIVSKEARHVPRQRLSARKSPFLVVGETAEKGSNEGGGGEFMPKQCHQPLGRCAVAGVKTPPCSKQNEPCLASIPNAALPLKRPFLPRQVELIGPGSRHQIRAGFAHMRWPYCALPLAK